MPVGYRVLLYLEYRVRKGACRRRHEGKEGVEFHLDGLGNEVQSYIWGLVL